MKIKTTQYVLDTLKHIDSNKKDYYLNFINLLISKKGDVRPVFIYSGLLKDIFGDREYTKLRNELKDLGLIEHFYNKSEITHTYITYKLKFKVKQEDILEYTLTNPLLIKRINKTKEESFYKLPEYVKQMYFNIEELILPEDCSHYISKSNSTGRIFHTLTSLKRVERENLIHLSGEQLIEIDAKNAQLIFLTTMFNEDVNFNNDVFEGVFYEKLAQTMGVDITDDEVRKEFKRKFFNSILFNENKIVMANSKYTQAFLELYPKMYGFLLTMESDISRANKLQSLESEFFILNLARDIINENIWLVTIHDALLIKKKDFDRVIDIFNNLSISIFGRLFNYSVKEGAIPLSTFSPVIIIKERENKRDKYHYIGENTNSGIAPVQFNRQEHNKVINDKKKEKTLEILKSLYKPEMTQKELYNLSGKSLRTIKTYWKSIANLKKM